MSTSLLVPLGTGLATNVFPSLPPIDASLGCDVTTYASGSLYLGNGSVWNNIGQSSMSSDTLSAFTMTSAGSNPSLSANLYLQGTAGSAFTMVDFELDINSSITAVTPDTWTSSVGVISAGFRPATTCNFPLYVTVNGAYETANAILTISSAGTVSVKINFTYTSTTVVFTNCNGTFKH